jgi:hypothetical protein
LKKICFTGNYGIWARRNPSFSDNPIKKRGQNPHASSQRICVSNHVFLNHFLTGLDGSHDLAVNPVEDLGETGVYCGESADDALETCSLDIEALPVASPNASKKNSRVSDPRTNSNAFVGEGPRLT